MKTFIGSVDSPSIHSKNNINVVYVNTFPDDNYHSFNNETETISELDSKIDKIKHINKNPETYLESLTIYNEYMGLLENKYGGPELFRLALKNQMVSEKIPPKPEFKVNDNNRDAWKIIKNGGAISKVVSLRMTPEKEEDYLQRSGFYETIDEVTIEAGEHPKELKKLIVEQFAYLEEEEEPLYVGSKSMGNFLEMKYGKDMNKDGSMDFEVTLGDIWENSPRYQKKLADREKEEDLVDVNVNTRWRRCSKNEMDIISSFEQNGWNIAKMKKLFSGEAVSEKRKEKKKDKKKKKHRDEREEKFSDFVFSTKSKNIKDSDGIFKDFADFTKEYLNFDSNNILLN